MAEIRPKLERAFAGWAKGDVPAKNIGTVAQQPRSTVYLLDRPEAIQSLILVGNVAPPKANPDEPAIETMNLVLGGSFLARINMNLREDKHWSYGSFTFFRDAKGQRPFVAYAPVQTDKTKEALIELQKELRGILSRPAADGGGARPGQVGAHAHAAGQLGDDGRRLRHARGHRHLRPRRPLLRHLRRQGAGADRRPRSARRRRRSSIPTSWSGSSWATGRRSRPGIRELKLGEIKFIDADGKPLGAS